MDPTYGRAKAGRPARTYIHQLCQDAGCSPEDLPEAINNREKWRERVRDICASGTTWWWWWWFDWYPIGLGLQNTPTASLQRSKTPPRRVRRCDVKQYNDEAPVMLEFWGMQSTPSLLPLPGPLWPRMVLPERVESMGQKGLLTFELWANNWLMLKWMVWNRTICSSNCV